MRSSRIVSDYTPGLPADEFVGNLIIDGFLSPGKKPEFAREGAQIDHLKLMMWIVGALVPWAGVAVLLVAR
jgi:hypothetical protein